MGVKINYGCGELPVPGYINIDSTKNAITKPDIIGDILQGELPFKTGEVDEFRMLHCLEHIEKSKWNTIFAEVHRLLSETGEFILAYPEFEICANNFITNYKGARDYWQMTLYGRQLHKGDYHVVPMRTADIINQLEFNGFKNIRYGEDTEYPWNTFVICNKDIRENREDLYRREIFGLSK